MSRKLRSLDCAERARRAMRALAVAPSSFPPVTPVTAEELSKLLPLSLLAQLAPSLSAACGTAARTRPSVQASHGQLALPLALKSARTAARTAKRPDLHDQLHAADVLKEVRARASGALKTPKSPVRYISRERAIAHTEGFEPRSDRAIALPALSLSLSLDGGGGGLKRRLELTGSEKLCPQERGTICRFVSDKVFEFPSVSDLETISRELQRTRARARKGFVRIPNLETGTGLDARRRRTPRNRHRHCVEYFGELYKK